MGILHHKPCIHTVLYDSSARFKNIHGLHYGNILFYIFYLCNIIGASEDIDSGRNPHYYDLRGCRFNHMYTALYRYGTDVYSNYYCRCVTANKVVTAVNVHAVRSPRKTPDNLTSYFRSDFFSSLLDTTIRLYRLHYSTI